MIYVIQTSYKCTKFSQIYFHKSMMSIALERKNERIIKLLMNHKDMKLFTTA